MTTYGMFTPQGDKAVHKALEPRLKEVRRARKEGYEPTDRKLENLMFEVMTVVTEQGFREVGDTAVREAIWAELKKA